MRQKRVVPSFAGSRLHSELALNVVKGQALFLIAMWSLLPIWQADTAWADEKTIPTKTLASIFPKAKEFVAKNAALTPDKVAPIEKELGAKLAPEDLKPTFYIALNEEKKPMGLVLFVDVKGPHDAINGGVGLDMQGKVVKVEVYKHKEAAGIADEKFLKQLIGKGIEDPFQVGKDVQPIAGQEVASQAVALIPKKMLLMSYALFLKKPTPKVEEKSPELIEPYNLKELMEIMKGYYNLIRDYFQTGENKEAAVEAAERLSKYARLIGDFEPPKNPDQTDEYAYFQQKVQSALQQFAQTLKKEGVSDHTKKQWQELLDLVNKAHLRFSEEPIDLDKD